MLMQMETWCVLTTALSLTLAVTATPTHAGSKVELEQTAEGWRLIRDGKPYVIKGAGGHEYLDQLAAAGGNSIRTWGVGDHTGALLDEAHKLGLTVTLGVWLQHERGGFNYDNPDDLAKQVQDVRDAIEKYKDHPALLMWALGNEMEGDGSRDAIFEQIERLAQLVKQLDPDHPTITVIAELGENAVKTRKIHALCPSIDVIGINSYGGIRSVPDRYLSAGGTKPYVVTEHGPLGHWECGQTSWGMPIEMTSTQKMDWYREGYQAAVLDHPDVCLGSYAFLWGDKQEMSATWYGMFLHDGTRMGAVDVMTELWSGKPPANRCPLLHELTVERDTLAPGDTVTATVNASDPDGDALTYEWVLRPAVLETGYAGEGEPKQPEMEAAIVSVVGTKATIRAPQEAGGYRLFCTVRDGRGNGAVANAPLLVTTKAQHTTPAGKAKALPFTVYDDGSTSAFAPSGYMGNTTALQVEETSTQHPHSGAACMKVTYTAPDQWAGIAWQSPADDWGDKPGGHNLAGAQQLTFYARGETGGEIVNFLYGILGPDKAYPDASRGELNSVKLTNQWQRYTIPLAGKDLGVIKTGFAFSLAGQGKPVTFYLDDVRYE